MFGGCPPNVQAVSHCSCYTQSQSATTNATMPNKENSTYDQTKEAVDGVYKNAGAKVEQAKEATNDTVKAASDKVNSAYEGTKGAFQRAGDAVSDTTTSLTDGIKGTAQGLADSKPAKAAKDAMHSAGEAITNATK